MSRASSLIDNRMAVKSVGMTSPVGLNAASSCAAIRARISRFEEIPFHDQAGKPIVASAAPEGVDGQTGYRRIVPMLCRAVLECISLSDCQHQLQHTTVPLFIAIDSPERPDYPDKLPLWLLAELRRIAIFPVPEASQVFLDGKAGFFRALDAARLHLQNGEFQACIVVGVDSLINGLALSWLEQHERLKTELNSDGVIPGEAAAALWVAHPDSPIDSKLEIVGIGFAEELSVLDTDAPNLAVGLAEAMRQSLVEAGLEMGDIDFRVGAIGGERAEFMEASTSLARLLRARKERIDLWLPAEKLGDVGAALPACMMVVVAAAFAKGYAPGPRALLFSSSASPTRAACVVISPKEIERYGM